jgi:nicotinamidase-related amidase
VKDLILVCGAQQCFFHEHGSAYLGEKAEPLARRIKEFLESRTEKDSEVYFTYDVRSVEDSFFRGQPTMNYPGSPDLLPAEILAPLVRKKIRVSRPSAWFGGTLSAEIKKIGPKSIYLIGAETHSAICLTAADLRYRGFDVIVPEPLVASREDFYHGAGISMMATELGVNVVSG